MWWFWITKLTINKRPTTQTTNHRPPHRAGHEPVCLVLGWNPPTACALLEFRWSPCTHPEVLYSVDVGMTTTTPPALNIYSCFVLKLVAGQRSSLQQQLQSVSLCHLIHRFYLVKIDCINMLCSCMVPGILPNWPSTKLGPNWGYVHGPNQLSN